MGGKDSPIQCTLPKSLEMQRKQQKPLPQVTHVAKSNSYVNLYVPKSNSSVSLNTQDRPGNQVTPSATLQLPEVGQHYQLQERQPSPTRSGGSVSPIRQYMECIEPRTLSCAIVGDSAVGKTSLVLSYTTGNISDTRGPTIYDNFTTSVCVRGQRIEITLCDTSGQDDFAHLRSLCYPQLDAVLICFSVVDTASYENVKSKWCKEIRRHCPGVPIILIGTQVDKREDSIFVKELKSKGLRTVSRSEGNKLASLIKATSYIECSALRQLNVKKAFDEAIAAALELDSSHKLTPQSVRECTIL